ncbi:MAG: class I SAM-dependent methyltransferase [Candidatus Limnocylindrales bacterium]
MTDNDRLMEIMLDVHSGLPRQGPGDDASTLRALAACTELPARPAVLDVGCGPGMQTVALAQNTDGTVTAVDLFEQFLDELRARATEAGVRDRIQVMRADMSDLPFGKDSFDLVWSEGAAYIMGITEAFTHWKEFLRPDGYIVITELSWLVPEAQVPKPAFDFFHNEYPGVTDVPGNLARIEACGYEIVDHFTLPPESWWTDYYTPLEAKLESARSRYAGDTTALELLASTTEELRVRREFGDSYGYEFIIARLLHPDTLPREAEEGESGESADTPAPPDAPSAETPAQYPPPLD